MLKRILVVLVAVMFMVGFTEPSFADEKKGGSEMKGGEKKDEKKKYYECGLSGCTDFYQRNIGPRSAASSLRAVSFLRSLPGSHRSTAANDL